MLESQNTTILMLYAGGARCLGARYSQGCSNTGPSQASEVMLKRHCRRKERPAWQLLLGSRDFGAIMLLNAMMFMTQNGSRAVLVPLLATQAFGVTTTTLGTDPPSPSRMPFTGPAVV